MSNLINESCDIGDDFLRFLDLLIGSEGSIDRCELIDDAGEDLRPSLWMGEQLAIGKLR